MKKFFLIISSLYAFFIVYKTAVSAHVGGGPPFLVVNGVYAQTNPYFFNDPSITIPQDYTGKTYIVNTPINLFVDTNQLMVPPDIVARSTFRWTFAEGSTEYAYGVKLTHTYTKPGSYLLSLEVKAPEEAQYTLIDTVQLDVLPNDHYQLPKASIAVATDHRDATKQLFFQSTYSVDKTTKLKNIIWGFGDGATSVQSDAYHTYTSLQDYSTFPVIFRVTDTNGFKGYAGVIVEAIKGKLHFIDNLGKESTIPVSDTLTKIKNKTNNQTNSIPWLPTAIGIAIIVTVAIGIISTKRLRK